MKKILYFVFITLFVLIASAKTNAQIPLVLEITEEVVYQDSVRLSIFGLFLANVDSVFIAPDCKGTRATDPDLVFDDNNTHFKFPRSHGPITGVIIAYNPSGPGNSFFTYTLPGPYVPEPQLAGEMPQLKSRYFEVSNADNNVLASEIKEVLEVNIYPDLITEKAVFTWGERLPIPNPLPENRFANPENTMLQSTMIYFYATPEIVEDAWATIDFFIHIDSLVIDTITVVDTLQADTFDVEQHHYHYQWGDRPTTDYPLFLTTHTYHTIYPDQNNTPLLDGSVTIGTNNFDVQFDKNADLVALGQTLIQNGLADENLIVSRGGLPGITSRLLLDNRNSVASGDLSELYLKQNNSTGGLTQPIVQLSHLKYFNFDEVSVGDMIEEKTSKTAQFVIRNQTDSTFVLGPDAVYIAGADSLDFEVTEQPAIEIAAFDSTFFSVKFIPDTIGNKTAYLIIKDNNRPEGETMFYITGIGTDPVPVELTSFSSKVSESSVTLLWSTATETNNSGFKIERAVVDAFTNELTSFENIGFVAGKGTTAEPQSYSFTDNAITGTKAVYRLKQTDYDGTYEYSDEIEVTLGAPTKFELAQNYPNPFNPTTNIKFSLPETAKVNLTVFNSIGQQVAILVDEVKEAGYYRYEWNAANLASGVYFLRISAGNKFNTVKKMMLLK